MGASRVAKLSGCNSRRTELLGGQMLAQKHASLNGRGRRTAAVLTRSGLTERRQNPWAHRGLRNQSSGD